MLNFLKKLNIWGALREARDALELAQVWGAEAARTLDQQRAYIDRLHAALDTIAAMETPGSSHTVKKAARIAQEARK